MGINTEGLIYDRTGARNCLAVLEMVSPRERSVYSAKREVIFPGTYLYREKTADPLSWNAERPTGAILLNEATHGAQIQPGLVDEHK